MKKVVVIGGGTMGIGLGLVFLGKATTGGTDTLAALIQKLLAGAHKRIEECFTWDGIIERQIEVYKRVVDSRK